MMSVESAEAVILVTMDSIVHRQNCLSETVLATELPRELLLEALSVLEAEGRGADAQTTRQWFTNYGIDLPATPEAKRWTESVERFSLTLAKLMNQEHARPSRPVSGAKRITNMSPSRTFALTGRS